MAEAPVCVDCIKEGVTKWRPIAQGCGPRSPRCATHVRATKKRARSNAHGSRVRRGYEMTPEQYWALYEYQGGVCFICRKATGMSRHLAVEHEHNKPGCTHPPEKGCPRCWRGLACKRCNRLIAYMDVDTLARAIVFLSDPPAQHLFGEPTPAETVIYEGPLEDTSNFFVQEHRGEWLNYPAGYPELGG